MKLIILSIMYLATVNSAPEWSQTYSVSGKIDFQRLEKSEPLVEPFSAWYDAPKGNSRVDYYGGNVKTYQLTNVGKYGTSYRVGPIDNKHECLEILGTKNAKIKLVSVLPSLEQYKNIGNENLNGENAEKWQLTTTNGDRVDTYTIWLKYENKVAVPIRFEFKGYNTYLEKQYDYYYIDYENYVVDEVAENVFQVESSCQGLSNPNPQQLVDFNPLNEFFYPTSDDYVEFEFKQFIEKFNKVYKSDKERAERKEIFRQTLRYINSKNRDNLSYTLGINQFADRRHCELPLNRRICPNDF